MDFDEFNDEVSDVHKEILDYKSLSVYPQTFRLLNPYAKNDDAYAKYIIGMKYLDGDEVIVNREKGLELLLESAKDGYSHAYYELANRYSVGKGASENKEFEIYYLKLLSDSAK